MKDLFCWHCSAEIIRLKTGWICSRCAQHGPPVKEPVPTEWRDAMALNSPYRSSECDSA